MTVEASIVLPLFLFFFLQMSGFIEMLRLHANLQYGLWKAGKSLMLYGAVEEVAQAVPELAVSYVYVNGVLQNTLGREYLDGSPLSFGSNGLNYLESDILTKTGEIDLALTYQVSPRGQLLPFPYARMANRFYGKVWNGYEIAVSDKETRVVYVTEYGEVWHITRECSHVKLTIEKIQTIDIWKYRNQQGKPYTKCSFCALGTTSARMYITKEGECYHFDESCVGLTRHVRVISWEEKDKYRPCSRCVGG